MRALNLPRCLCLLSLSSVWLHAPSAAALEVTLSGFAEQSRWTRSFGALLQVSVPLERLVFSPALVPSSGLPQDDAGSDEAARQRQEAEPAEPGASETPSPSANKTSASEAKSKAEGASVSASKQAAAERLARVSEPRVVQRLVHAALRDQRSSEDRLASLDFRSRHSAWLPELRFKIGRNTDQSLRLTPTQDDPSRYQVTGAADLRFEGQVTWKFHRLVFADEQIAVERLRGQRAQAYQKLAHEVLELLFAWQSAEVRVQSDALHDDERALAELQALQARLALDVLTHGAFSRELASATPTKKTQEKPARPAGQ